ncbi:hypothetical protein HAX54_024939, partial [Datura stramonium]|nr:hypothetical protein [Datura stramonium]
YYFGTEWPDRMSWEDLAEGTQFAFADLGFDVGRLILFFWERDWLEQGIGVVVGEVIIFGVGLLVVGVLMLVGEREVALDGGIGVDD